LKDFRARVTYGWSNSTLDALAAACTKPCHTLAFDLLVCLADRSVYLFLKEAALVYTVARLEQYSA
jgi:hypothetical protein